ncbi:compactin nonaketide synthase mlcA [Colletotrichum liriopes]|uniref:Compactin nonaketide synthase mlcA n=1 Tax=Colletotrichum liriopes TaxID=708192 RepID=A0AA37GXY8_9PEZI|nr:compactin nonaketide synthase mlcA [Colletotrichum liriopes]
MQMTAATGEAGNSVLSIDLLELRIPKAISLNDPGTELVTSMTHIKRHSGGEPGDDVITAEFKAFSITGKEATSMALKCTGCVRILLGASSNSTRVAPQSHLSTIDVDRFYQVLRDDFGFGYYGAFHGLTSIQRKTNCSTATIHNPAFEKDETPLLFHLGMLDNTLQGLNAAYSAPGDGRPWSIVAPTAVRRITLVPDLCGDKMTDEVLIDCTITDPRPDCVTGDVNVYLSIPCEESEENDGGSKNITKQCIEVEGITFPPSSPPPRTTADSYSKRPSSPLTSPRPRSSTVTEQKKALDAERAAFFYLKNLHVSIDAEKRTERPWYRQALLSN